MKSKGSQFIRVEGRFTVVTHLKAFPTVPFIKGPTLQVAAAIRCQPKNVF